MDEETERLLTQARTHMNTAAMDQKYNIHSATYHASMAAAAASLAVAYLLKGLRKDGE